VFFTFFASIAVLGTLFKDRLFIQKRLMALFYKDYIRKPEPKQKTKTKASRLKLSDSFKTELQTAGVMMRLEEFATLWILVSFLPSGIIAITTANAPLALLFAFAGIILPPFYVKKQKKKRVAAFENQLSDALVIMCNCLRSSLSLSQAFENVASEMSEPISKEFSRAITEIKYGSSLEKALNSMSERIGSGDFMLAVTAINIQRQVGGNLSEILRNISETIQSRIKLKGEIKVLTATGRVSGIIIGCLPIAIGLMIFILNPDYMLDFIATRAGKIMLLIGVIMEFIGFLVIRKIITIKY